MAQAIRDSKASPKQMQVAGVLYCNRAAAYLKLEKFDKVSDCFHSCIGLALLKSKQCAICGGSVCRKYHSPLLATDAAMLTSDKTLQASIDAGAAAILDPSNFKAWFRKGLAHKELNQWFECHQAMKHAVKLETNNEDVKTLYEEAKYKMTMPQAHAPPPAPPPVTESRSRRKLGIFGR